MGRKKKFIEKKNSATFQLLARDSSDPNYSADSTSGDRVFIRVDNNRNYNPEAFAAANEDDDPDSIFADAPEDDDVDTNSSYSIGFGGESASLPGPLPEKIRKEIIELGFPDDGYNYLLHLREIKNTGGGSAFYHNPRVRLDQLNSDVKAYDASRVRVAEVRKEEETRNDDRSIYSVAAKTVDVKVQKVVDPEVVALLDDSDLSRFGSDVEEFEDDFVVRANLAEEEGERMAVEEKEVEAVVVDEKVIDEVSGEDVDLVHNEVAVGENTRVRRTLDEQFDLLEHQEYGTNDEDDDGCYMGEEDEYLDGKIEHSLNNLPLDDLELSDKYEVEPDIIERVQEYAKKYENEDENNEFVIVEESSDESEKWDCETIVTTYSNLDNHPGRIGAPEAARKKKITESVSGAMNATSHVISLRGREKLPVDFLPHRKNSTTEKKAKAEYDLKIEPQKRRQHGQESKEEKKERKAAVKEERREARRVKKEMKGLYKYETQRAQRVAAVAGPSSIHLM